MLTKEQMDALPVLVAEATPGPWKVCETSIHGRKYGGCWVEGPDEEDDNGNLHGALIPVSGSHGSKSYTTRLVDRQDHDHNDANARLIALAPTLAATVIEQQAEIERLRAYVADFANTKFEQIDNRGRNWRGPEDDEDPVTDWMTIDAWQEDARALLLGATQ